MSQIILHLPKFPLQLHHCCTLAWYNIKRKTPWWLHLIYATLKQQQQEERTHPNSKRIDSPLLHPGTKSSSFHLSSIQLFVICQTHPLNLLFISSLPRRGEKHLNLALKPTFLLKVVKSDYDSNLSSIKLVKNNMVSSNTNFPSRKLVKRSRMSFDTNCHIPTV